MMAMLVWKIHVIRATLLLRSMMDDPQVSSNTVIPDGSDPTEVEVWYFTLNDSVTVFDLARFCEPLGQHLCHMVTSGALKKLVLVSANFSEVNVVATTFDSIVEAAMPEFYISLIPDNEDDVEEQHPGFLQLAAATWGLNRIRADQRDRSYRTWDYHIHTRYRCSNHAQ